MNALILISLGLVVLIPVVMTFLFRRRRNNGKGGYQRNPALFSPEERHVYALLREAVGEEYAVFGKIPVGEIIQPRMENRRQSLPGEYGELAEHCLTFVLCDRRDLAVAGVVELRNHARGSQQPARDGLLQALCTAAGLPLIAIRSGALHDPCELRALVLGSLKQDPLPVPHGDGRKEPRISSMEGLNLE